MVPAGAITVGVDESDAGVGALVWAVQEGSRRGLTVEVMTAWPAQDTVMVHEVPGHYSDARARAGSTQRRAVVAAELQVGSLEGLGARLVNTRPVDALLAASRTSSLLVIGSRHPGRDVARRGPGTLVARCYEEASCSVSVVDPTGAVRSRAR